MKQFLSEIFVWWGGQTWGTRLALRAFDHVGTDAFGNKYYKAKKDDRRWVIYNGPAEASAIPPGWHGWMHHRTDIIPTDQAYTPRTWQKDHIPNHTGTSLAYRPEGSLLASGERPRVSGDYDAWSPE